MALGLRADPRGDGTVALSLFDERCEDLWLDNSFFLGALHLQSVCFHSVDNNLTTAAGNINENAFRPTSCCLLLPPTTGSLT